MVKTTQLEKDCANQEQNISRLRDYQFTYEPNWLQSIPAAKVEVKPLTFWQRISGFIKRCWHALVNALRNVFGLEKKVKAEAKKLQQKPIPIRDVTHHDTCVEQEKTQPRQQAELSYSKADLLANHGTMRAAARMVDKLPQEEARALTSPSSCA